MRTVAAISTPNAVGGIAVIRMSGANATEIAEKIFVSVSGKKVTQMRGYTCSYGTVTDNGETVDDVLLTVFRAPHSYTGEDTVEISCHGGLYVSRRILSLLLAAGAEPAEAGEFTKRAYLNGKLSLSQAESVMDVIAADGEAALKQARLAKDGTLGKSMREISNRLVNLLSALAYWLDDAEECPPELERDTLLGQLDDISHLIAVMLSQYQNGKIFREGIRTVILGLPNAGKSAVMNWICCEDRSIVTEIAGTTRDVITEQVKIDEFTLVLSDTAGIRQTTDRIEEIGIQQAYKALETANLVLYVIDSAVGMTETDREMLERCKDMKCLILWNKNDISDAAPPDAEFPVLTVSAIHESNHRQLAEKLRELFDVSIVSLTPSVINERQYLLLKQAAESVESGICLVSDGEPLDMLYSVLEFAAQKLREIEGDGVTEEIIDGVFSKFCVGK